MKNLSNFATKNLAYYYGPLWCGEIRPPSSMIRDSCWPCLRGNDTHHRPLNNWIRCARPDAPASFSCGRSHQSALLDDRDKAIYRGLLQPEARFRCETQLGTERSSTGALTRRRTLCGALLLH
jgi:hypothetical protein